jgi:hypothetical protein
MKKSRFLFGIAVLAILAVLLFVFVPSEQGWQRLPSGARVRVFTVTTGTKHHIDFPTRSWGDHYRKVFSRPSSIHFSELISRPHGWTGAVSNSPSIVIWFQTDRFVSYDSTLITADSQRYRTSGANGPSTDGYGYASMQFPVVPSEKTLHLEATFEGKLFRFEIDNPAYRLER